MSDVKVILAPEKTLRGSLAGGNTLKGGVSVGGGTKIELDTTLTQSGKAADAKAVGDALAELEEKIPEDGSGVYVGSGEMPEGYNVQIDPDGSVVTEKWVFTLADGRSVVKEVVTV